MNNNGITLDFVGISVSRCGTTWLAKCLAEHPEIFIPPKKELAYYNNPQRMDRESLPEYFADAESERLLGEYTPRYIISRDALERVAEDNPGAKVLVSLRDPVERAFSQYKYFRFQMDNEDITDFETALTGPNYEDYITKSEYATNLQRAWDIFGRDSTHVMFSHDFSTRPAEVVAEMYGFLGVDTEFQPGVLGERLNQSGTGKEAVLGTNLSEDGDVMVRGRRLDGIRSFGESVSEKLRIRPAVEAVGGPILNVTEQAIGKVVDGNQSDSSDTNTLPPLNEETKEAVFKEHFTAEISRLESMLDEDLSRWKY